jgi:hypothetical protein
MPSYDVASIITLPRGTLTHRVLNPGHFYCVESEMSSCDMGSMIQPGPWPAVDVEPIGNRLVVFWSDTRVPHEAGPAG